MNDEFVRYLVTTCLLPLLPGTEMEEGIKDGYGEALVVFSDITRLAFKIHASDSKRFVIHRSQQFARAFDSGLTELRLVRAFVNVVAEMEKLLDRTYFDDLRPGFERRVIARCLYSAPPQNPLLISILDRLDLWSDSSYEGGPISATFGIDQSVQGTGPAFPSFNDDDFCKVVSNGIDTVAALDVNGRLIRHECLEKEQSPTPYAPYRTAALADWTRAGRVVVALNRSRELMVFSDGKLQFARRFGRWFFLPHEISIKQMSHPRERRLREEVYASALDASFARTGACLGVVASKNLAEWQKLVAVSDHLQTSMTPKVQALRCMIGGRLFQHLDRRLRQELLAIDGATVIDLHGELLAVGAILRVDAGSTGGGRRAAAIALGKVGMGLKVSQDGAITGFSGNPYPSVTVMSAHQ